MAETFSVYLRTYFHSLFFTLRRKGGTTMPLMEISIVPVGTNTPSFSNMVKDVCRMVEQSGLHYQITPTATVIEGDLDRLMDVAREIHRSSMQNGTNRVITQITIDDRRDQPISLESQVAKVNGDVH